MGLTDFVACKRCRWEYMAEMSFCRRQPWTDDDSGLMFQTCTRCGQISIQHFENDGRVNGVWILHPDSQVMFRVGTAPSHVFDYVFTDDFLKNRGVTRGLFRGYLRSMIDLSGALNMICACLPQFQSLERVELSVELLRDVIAEFLSREESEESRRLSVTTLKPIIALMHGPWDVESPVGQTLLDLRYTALEILEGFANPRLWQSVPAGEAIVLEEAIDHMAMVDESIARMSYLSQGIDEEVLIEAWVESRFMYKVFRRRKARLSQVHSDAVWRLMYAIASTYTLGSPLDFATKTYESLRTLLEHQLAEAGLLKLGKHDMKGTECVAFQSPRTGDVLLIPMFYPQLAIFPSLDAEHPRAVVKSWVEALSLM